MPWLALEQILINSHEQTAIDKCMGYNILNPPPLGVWACMALCRTPPPTLKKIQVPKPPTLEETGPPGLTGYLLPGPVMATMQNCIEDLTF